MVFEDQQGLPENCRQYKGNLHSHTVNSDGCLMPEQSVELFKAQGYSFLCLSEHDRYTDYRAQLNSDDFILLPGLEATAVLLDNNGAGRLKVHHMHGILGTEAMQRQAKRRFKHMEALPPSVFQGIWDGSAVAQQLNDTLQEYGCLVTYNHPVWSRVEPHEFINIKGVFALEIYNYNTVNESGTGADTTYWDLMLRSGKQVYAFASDDNHNEGLFDDCCGGWVSVTAMELSHEAIIQALQRGEYYSSAGPTIFSWGVKNDRVWIECSACERVILVAGGFVNAGCTVIAPTRDGLHRVEIPLRGDETYVRLECVDYQGKTAWTNAIFLKKSDARRIARYDHQDSH
ncbi:MAG: PHP domain-containing protein [Dehalobacterium sp.]